MKTLAFLCFAFSLTAGAQSVPKLKRGTAAHVEGDLYLVMKSGDTKRGAGRTVYLLRDTKDVHERLALLCAVSDSLSKRQRDSITAIRRILKDSADAAYQVTMADIANSDKSNNWHRLSKLELETFSEESEMAASLRSTTRTLIDGAIIRAAVDTVGSGMNAHYSFTISKPGKYLLFSDWQIGDSAYRWWVPIEVSPGKNLRRDLDNSAEASESLYCGH